MIIGIIILSTAFIIILTIALSIKHESKKVEFAYNNARNDINSLNEKLNNLELEIERLQNCNNNLQNLRKEIIIKDNIDSVFGSLDDYLEHRYPFLIELDEDSTIFDLVNEIFFIEDFIIKDNYLYFIIDVDGISIELPMRFCKIRD